MKALDPKLLDAVPEWCTILPGENITHCLKIAPNTVILHGTGLSPFAPDLEFPDDCWVQIQQLLPDGQVVFFHPPSQEYDASTPDEWAVEMYLYACIKYLWARIVHGDDDPDIQIMFGLNL